MPAMRDCCVKSGREQQAQEALRRKGANSLKPTLI
jgi:hypothetical protein